MEPPSDDLYSCIYAVDTYFWARCREEICLNGMSHQIFGNIDLIRGMFGYLLLSGVILRVRMAVIYTLELLLSTPLLLLSYKAILALLFSSSRSMCLSSECSICGWDGAEQ